MPSIPFALSVHHFISSVGADAGFASLIGLALLVLLYFAHARETATLRSRADEAGLRVQELEMHLADLADQVAALPAEISVRATGSRVAAASVGGAQHPVGLPGAGYAPPPPAPPAGVAAPALAAATRLIPMPELLVAEPEPGTANGGANGASRVPVGASAGTVQRPIEVDEAPARPGGPRPPARPVPKRSRAGRVILALVVALIAAGVVVAAVVVLSNRSKSHKPAKSSVVSGATNHRTNSRSVLVKPSDVTVSVLNGTDLNGLAKQVSDKLGAEGFVKGAVTNATNQTQTTSIVAYAAPANRADALAVAQYLKLSANTVQAVNASTKQVACTASPQGCSSLVYVTVGSDLSTAQ